MPVFPFGRGVVLSVVRNKVMLTKEERALLEGVFADGKLRELTLQKAGTIALQTKLRLRAVEWFALDSGICPSRYRRNIGAFGVGGQKRLLESKVVIVGLGGLGGCLLEELARAGVGQIVAVDPDVFDETNLNRQLLASEETVGRKKVDEAESRSKKVNRAVAFTGFAVSLEQVAEAVWRDADLVFDCLDNIEGRFGLEERCSSADVALVHGAVAGWYGEVGVVWPGSGMLKKVYKGQGRGIEEDVGAVGFTAATAASLMAAKGVGILTGKITGKEQKMLYFDLLEDEWQTIEF